jgi:acyl transferase domain-containing protein/NAD(P)H-dependent flavin oxidoreductase YrpB (nitropropane dioxygenase family)/NAD(P)-dependent dehydrogenase (short-subunit alcohol dehydrogenase family)
MSPLDVIGVSPAGRADASLAIAACRAGARGVLDLEFPLPSEAQTALQRLVQFTSLPFGVKAGPECHARLPDLLGHPPERLAWVWLAGDDWRELATLVGQWHALGRQVWIEVVDGEEIRRAEQIGADGLILKGQEAGGRIGAETSFILLQRWRAYLRSGGRADLPVWVQGGVGLHTAAACQLAGATGVVLDAQLLLARESPLSQEARQVLGACDGSETTCLGGGLRAAYRIFKRPGLPVVAEAAREEERIAAAELPPDEKTQAWRQTVHRLAQAEDGLWLLGQDAAFARPLAARFTTVAGIIQGVIEQAAQDLAAAQRLRPLDEQSPLAIRHRTRYPLVQGPMTRVSDTAAFAEAVAEGGALPFLALALLRQAETEALLEQTRECLGERPWGVGILGFVPPEIRKEQIAAIRACRPPFALIAGGRPDQARELEQAGIPTYLHVPSPGLLRSFLRDGARRFVFEGRECGGHVGPRSSFVLWETMIEVLLEHLGPVSRGDDLAVLFAGGIHDALSGAMVSALAAPLAERGVAIGALLGTAYLFTQEAVPCGAIVPRFQEAALRCSDTVLLQTAPGHAIRCIPTPYCDDFERERARLQAEGRSHEEIARALEWMNIGRLRIASKGLDRAPEGSRGPRLVSLPDDEQYTRGMYMIGQVATLRDRVLSIGELHHDICAEGTRRLQAAPTPVLAIEEPSRQPCDVAIVGMACFYPGACGVGEYWQNILSGVNAVTEVPDSHWDWRLYYDPDPRARDKIISRWGGFLRDFPFDPMVYGIAPNSISSIEPLQLYVLEAARLALVDAGYAQRPFPRARTASILGIGGGGSPLAVAYGFRTCLPLLDHVPGIPATSAQILEKSKELLPEWTEDSFPGILFNVAVGRVANRLNLGGPNYAIDAACGSSLAAVQACVRELETGSSDMAIALGADTVQTPYAYMAFSKTHALSPRGRCRPFDAGADGIVLSEGIGAVILKRLADAERDGDRIYAVIKGMGASSDGRDKGLTAPRPEGQLRALRRAYRQAGVSPAEVELIEAHGTGTVAGDQTEAQSLGQLLQEAGAVPQGCAVGSVKSMIGHTKCAAGIAGLVKTALALHHGVLPPTLVEQPNVKGDFEQGPLYLNTQARPWVHGGPGPRHAGVSAFGFGGTNFHAVLSEYTGGFVDEPAPALPRWPAELLIWSRSDRAELLQAIEQCRDALAAGARLDLTDLAAATWRAAAPDAGRPTLAVIADSLDDLRDKLSAAAERLRAGGSRWHDPRGLYFAEEPGDMKGSVAFLFPGQGSQYPNMLASVGLAFRQARRQLDRAERALTGLLDRPLGKFIYPGSAFSTEKERLNKVELTRADVAQPAIGAVSLALYRLLYELGVEAHFFAGHSYGEYVALCAAGALDEDELIRLSYHRGRTIRARAGAMPGGMVALSGDVHTAGDLLSGIAGVTVANTNSPAQTVVSGDEQGLQALLQRCQARGIPGQRLEVACAFHSPLVAVARAALAEVLGGCRFRPPARTVFANATAAPYPADPAGIASLLVEHLTSPVRFREEVEAMYAAGARLFVEVGPQGVLTGLVGQTLRDRPHLAVASDVKGRPGIVQLLHLLGQLVAHGVAVRPKLVFQGRVVRSIDLENLPRDGASASLSPTTWIVNSVRSRPLNAPEPLLLGQRPRSPEARPAAAGEDGEPTNGERSATPRESDRPPTSVPAASANRSRRPKRSRSRRDVILRFQQLMARFLETQERVMSSYLDGSEDAADLPDLLPTANGEEHRSKRARKAKRKPKRKRRPTEPERTQAPAATGTQAAPSESPAAPPRPDRTWLANHLVDLVSQQTGYPREMLGLDIDLEADLGIDSIKRVEILAKMADALGARDTLSSNIEMEKLTVMKTLRGIIDYLDTALNPAQQVAAAPIPAANGYRNGQAPAEAEDVAAIRIQRGLVALVDAPLPAQPSFCLANGTVLFTDDGRGVAWEMAGRMADLGQKTALVRMVGAGAPAAEGYAADLTDPAAVAEVLRRVRADLGPIGGLVHLLPLAGPLEGENGEQRARREVKSLYLLARELGSDLTQADRQRSAFLLAATAMGGSFGFGDAPLPPSFSPGHGGVLGFVKCLAQEWSGVLVRGVDLDIEGKRPGELAERLLGELGDWDGPIEVGYADGRRVTWGPCAAPLSLDDEAPDLLGPDSTVLITGGTRGITAAVALELARRYQPTLILVGRSALPPERESPDTADLESPSQIKAALIARGEAEGRPPTAAMIEPLYQRLMQDREIRANLARLRETGARVHYFSVDVRDRAAFGQFLDEVQERFGPLDGVIHGAGVIEDRLVRDKTPESFDRVFDTKVVSALTLAEHVRPQPLRFCVFFASIASRYGNKGQADYAAANEVLSKLALALDRQWPGRVCAVAWGPWSSVGMVADLEKHLVRRGLRLITPDEGPRLLVEELLFGRKGDSEVILAGGAAALVSPVRESTTVLR